MYTELYQKYLNTPWVRRVSIRSFRNAYSKNKKDFDKTIEFFTRPSLTWKMWPKQKKKRYEHLIPQIEKYYILRHSVYEIWKFLDIPPATVSRYIREYIRK